MDVDLSNWFRSVLVSLPAFAVDRVHVRRTSWNTFTIKSAEHFLVFSHTRFTSHLVHAEISSTILAMSAFGGTALYQEQYDNALHLFETGDMASCISAAKTNLR